MTTLGIIGAGHIGSNVARTALKHGYDVVISNSRGPETLSGLIAELGPKARAGTATEAARAGDLVLVAIPLKHYRQVPVEALVGKTVIDTNNYYPQRDGHVAELDDGSTTSSELLQRHLPQSHVVKAINNIRADEIPTTGSPAGTPNRRALPISGENADAKRAVTAFLTEIGFDVVDLGPLTESWRTQPGTPAYVVSSTVTELRERLAAATRQSDR